MERIPVCLRQRQWLPGGKRACWHVTRGPPCPVFRYTRTKFTTPFVDKFFIDVETFFFNDNGGQPNVFNLSAAELADRVVDVIDIANDPVEKKDYKPSEDPKVPSRTVTTMVAAHGRH